MSSIDDLLDKHDESEKRKAEDNRKRANEYVERINQARTVVDETIRKTFLPKLLELEATFKKRGYATKLVLNDPYVESKKEKLIETVSLSFDPFKRNWFAQFEIQGVTGSPELLILSRPVPGEQGKKEKIRCDEITDEFAQELLSSFVENALVFKH